MYQRSGYKVSRDPGSIDDQPHKTRNHESPDTGMATAVAQLLPTVVVLSGFSLVACNRQTGGADTQNQHAQSAPYVETGDLPRIVEHGKLRLIVLRRLGGEELVRRGHPASTVSELAQGFARGMGLQAVPVYVDAHEQLIPALLEGKGDVILAHLTVTTERAKHVAFTAPVALVHEQIVTRVDDDTLHSPADLQNRRVALRRSSAFWETIQTLRRRYPKIGVQIVPEKVDRETMLERVASGEYDVTVADSDLVDEVLPYRTDLRVAFDVARNRLIAWAVRPDAPRLRAALDRFLIDARAAEPETDHYHADLPGIKERRVLRVLTRNHPATYFIWRGEFMGFDYDLVKEFAKEQGLRVKMVVPPTWGDLIPWLRQGKGDLIAASMTITEERKQQGLVFSTPYNYVREMVVTRKQDREKLSSLTDVATRTFLVSPATSYWQTLTRLRAAGVPFHLQAAPGDLTTDDIIAKVAIGEYDLTVADSHLLNMVLTWRDDVKGAFALTPPEPLGWAVTDRQPKLLDAINAYIGRIYRGTFYSLTYAKYFENPAVRHHETERALKTGQLSPYDTTVRRYAARYGFDWRLIVAQMYEESRFDPNARSWAGARGLLQVMPHTVAELGFSDLRKPAAGIAAGIEYLAWLRDQFEGEIPQLEDNWFSLAAYNAGYGHMEDARELAAEIGLDRDRWFGHVEKAMLLLSKPEYFRRARFGYVEGNQPVKYVRDISARYDAYARAAGL